MPARTGRSVSKRTAILAVAAIVIALAIGWYLKRGGLRGTAESPSSESVSMPETAPKPAPEQEPSSPEPAPAIATSPPEASPPRGSGARVSIVIDDLGRSLLEVESLARLPVPISYSVLPFEHSTARIAAAVLDVGGELLCHLPMQPENGANPGPGALHGEMGRRELRRATRLALDAVPGAEGANHHMGSKMSADPKAMRTVLEVLDRRGLFYLDSKTSARSVGYRVGRELGLPTIERQVFLDSDRSPAEIRVQFRRLLELARQRGSAVAIGHPYPETVRVLFEELPAALAAGYEFVHAGDLVGTGS